jgi:hypothetical protein
LYLKYRINYALSWHGYEIKVVEFITRILTQPVSYFSDFSTVFYAFLKFTAGNLNKLYNTVPRFSTKPPETSLSSPMEPLAVVREERRHLTGQIRWIRVTRAREERGIS